MHDIRAIRQEPEIFDKAMERRGVDTISSTILELDEKRRNVQTELQEIQARRNVASKEIGKVKSQGGDAQDLMDEVASIKGKISEMEETDRTIGEELNNILSSIPNVMADDVPDGADEDENIEIRTWGTPKEFDGEHPDHVEIGEKLGMIDFETAAKVAGSRFVFLKSQIARLERALAQFMLDTHVNEHGLMEVSPPTLVNDAAMFGTGQLPKFAEDAFKTEQGYWLISTSEIALTNMVADMILDEEELPIRMTAYTPCYRSEAGSAGRDTRGMLRQHQFYKVEMVSITTPEQSQEEHERMTACAENILKKLELPFRTVILCSGDTGFCAKKTYDLEVWMPGQGKYREISSCSNAGDFQARRMKARCRKKGEKETKFVNTLNGSGLAVGRTLIAVIENYYDMSDGGIFVPEVLKPYMGGIEKILS